MAVIKMWLIFVQLYVHQLAKRTFRSRYAHTPVTFNTTCYTFKLDSDCKDCNQVKEGVSALQLSDWSNAKDVKLLVHMTLHSRASEGN